MSPSLAPHEFGARQLYDAAREELQKHYAGLEFMITDDVVSVDWSQVARDQQPSLMTDLTFFRFNSHLPRENICNHLDNYNPKNPSQALLLMYARLLLKKEASAAAGIYMFGDTGIGKTHISTALAKEFMLRGQEVYYAGADSLTTTGGEREKIIIKAGDDRHCIGLGPQQTWIIDDLNSPFGVAKDCFKYIVLNAHNKGGRVFVTSNKPYEEFMESAFTLSDAAERRRYEDRTRGMFKILAVSGESNRTSKRWFVDGIESPEHLRQQLDAAVDEERFEEAALIRDLLREIEGTKTS